MLENMRFHAAKRKTIRSMRGVLPSMRFVCERRVRNAHRAHCFAEGITHFVEKAAAGLFNGEGAAGTWYRSREPGIRCLILGGAKVSTRSGD